MSSPAKRRNAADCREGSVGSPNKRSRSQRLRQPWTINLRNEKERVKIHLERVVKEFDADQTLAKLWVQAEECSKFADVEIEFSDGMQLRAHRCVITLASTCFDRMFDSGMREALSCKIFEPSISRPAYREFLRYLYTGRCGPTADVIDGGDLYTLANMHDMHNLRDWVISLIDGQAVAAAAQFAYETHDDFLQEMCFKYARDNFSKISHCSLAGIEEHVLAKFIAQAPSQIDAFNLVNGWYTANVSDRHAGADTSQGQRCSGPVSVAALLQLIDLTKISAVSFRDVVIPSQLVPEQMITSVLLARAVDLEQAIEHASNWVNMPKQMESVSEFGRRGSGDGELYHPGGIDLSSEPNAPKIVVADGANHRVQIFDLDGNFEYSLGEEGHGVGQLQRPRDVCVTPKQDIVVADTGNDRIQIFNSDGSIAVLGLGPGSDPGQLRKPSGVAVSKDGRLVVADTGNNRIQIFNLNGTVEKMFGRAGSQEGDFKEPRAVAINSLGHILVSDTNNHRIQIFDREGGLQRCFGKLGDACGEFRMPRKIAIGPYDDIVVADKINNRVQVFSSDGAFIQSYGGDKDPEQFGAPVGVAVGAHGHIYVTEFGNDRVTVLVARNSSACVGACSGDKPSPRLR